MDITARHYITVLIIHQTWILKTESTPQVNEYYSKANANIEYLQVEATHLFYNGFGLIFHFLGV